MADKKPDIPEERDEILEDLIDHIKLSYEPVERFDELDEFITTQEIYDGIKNFYPSSSYDEGTVIKLLFEAGFKYKEVGRIFYWLMRKK